MVLGPPGCGKTTRLLGLLEAELNAGVPPHRLACVTFTRAARQQVQDRVIEHLGLTLADFPWIRTLHSAAFRLLQLDRDRILGEERWAEFTKRHGYRLSDLPTSDDAEDEANELPGRTPDDALRGAYGWGRGRGLGVDETLAQSPVDRLSASGLRLFWRRLDAFKAEHGLFDFADLLQAVIAGGLRPDIDVLFVDEAQDLSAQQIAVVESWIPGCSRVYVAGDEDQAIYGFQGAEPSWLLGLAKTSTREVLQQSYRVPAAVHALANNIIRQNTVRVQKEYRPRPAIGQVRFLAEHKALAAVDGSRTTFVLARNRFYLGRWAAELMRRAVPFVVEGRGGSSPLSRGRPRMAVDLALRLGLDLGDRWSVHAAPLDALLSYVPTSSGLVPRGAKARVREARLAGRVFSAQELRTELGISRLLDALRAGGGLAPLTGISARDRQYFDALISRYGCLPEPRITLTSIHGAKGREADLVVVLPDLTRSTARTLLGSAAGREAENRVFYVGVTRAREELIVVAPRGRRHYQFPSFRFGEGRL